MTLPPSGPKVDITPDVVAVGEGNGSVTFVLSATREVSVEVRTVAGTAGKSPPPKPH